MDIRSRTSTPTYREQLEIKANCFHPSGHFVEFGEEDVEQSIPQRFELIARIHPERLALSGRNLAYTYDSLNKAANRLAFLLLESSRESVAFLSNRTHGIVSILAILKAGKTYVALDPLTPAERNIFYLRESGADILVTDHEHFGTARALAQDGQRIINLNELRPGTDANPGVDIPPDTAAGIFYTSGSTGKPKGVLQSHRNVLHDASIRINDHHICAEDRFAITQSLIFSASIRTVFPALLAGAALFPYNIRENTVADLGGWVDEQRITFLGLSRQLLGAFTAFCGTRCTSSHLRVLQTGGELIYATEVRAFQKHMPEACVLSIQYSITETGSITTYMVDKRSAIDERISIPVGYPPYDINVFLLDNDGNEVANGEVGEIVVKSRYLSPGYWHQPDLTDRVFSADPRNSQERTYRTGDLGRFAPDGCLFLLGRNDSQVKIRGYRVEIAEVEQALLEHPSVQQALVKGYTQEHGDVRLVGYVSPAVGGQNPTVSELRRHLGTRLADYMIPSTFILLDAFPITASGKVDRNALPAPDQARAELDQPYCPPSTNLEKQLTQVWTDLLHLDRVGIHDNFFELGGHSLLATQLISKVRTAFEIDLPLGVFMETPTIAGLAESIETMRWVGGTGADPRSRDDDSDVTIQ